MSFILKALKKLEEEKAARQVRPPDISSGILTPDTPSTPSSQRILIPALIMVLVVAGAGISFFLLTGDRAGMPAGKSLPQPAPRVDQATQTLPSAPAPLAAPVVATKTTPSEKAPEQPASGSSHPARADSPSPPGAPAGAAPPGIKVNGIALQDDPYQSVAVVNGILARKGMIIQGMRIEEILGDGVKFSGNGETFNVKVSK